MTQTIRMQYVGTADIEIPQGGNFRIRLYIKATDRDTGASELLDTDGYTAEMTVRDDDFDGNVVLVASTTDGRITVGFDPPKSERATVYVAGQEVVPESGLNGFIYRCTTGGTSHAADEPAWPTTVSGTVADGTVTWTCITAEALGDHKVANVLVDIDDAVTDLLTDWGRGLWSLEVEDTFGESMALISGVARLSRNANL